MDLLPDALVAPGVEVVGDGFPGREVVGQHAPSAAATRQVQHGSDDLAHGIGAWSAGSAVALREQVLDVVPLEVRQVTGYRFRAMVFMSRKIPLTARRRKTTF